MYSPIRQRRGGFTLVELLVVITIITILAGLATVGISAALVNARSAQLALEITNISRAIDDYYLSHGAHFPCTVDVSTAAGQAALSKHIRKVFRNNNETTASVTAFFGSNKLDPSETLVFFLGRTSKSLKNNPMLPISGPGKPIGGDLFKETQLFDHDGDGFLSYAPANGEETFIAYFDHSSYAASTSRFSLPNKGEVRPYLKSATTNDFINPETYQLISAGLDGHYGHYTNATDQKVFPAGINYDIHGEEDDNIANFSEGRAFKDHLP